MSVILFLVVYNLDFRGLGVGIGFFGGSGGRWGRGVYGRLYLVF